MKIIKMVLAYFCIGIGVGGFSGTDIWAGKWVLEILPSDAQGEILTVACRRPVLPGGRRVCIEENDQQRVYTAVGHGGSGWSNGPGYVKNQIDLFFNAHKDKAIRIAVVGDGLISRVWRYHLAQAGYTRITVYVDPATCLTSSPSYRATGVYSPDMSSDEEMKAARATLAFYKELNRALGGPDFLETIHVISNVLMGGYPTELTKDPQREVALIDDRATVQVCLGGKSLKDYGDLLVYKTQVIHNRRILDALGQYLQKKAPYEKRRSFRVESLEQLSDIPIVIDASGMGIGVGQNCDAVGHQTFESPGHYDLKLSGEGGFPNLRVGLNMRAVGKSRVPLGDGSCIQYLHFMGHGDYDVLGGTWQNYALMAKYYGVSEIAFEKPEYNQLNELKARWRRSVWFGLQEERVMLEGLIQELGHVSFPTMPELWTVPKDESEVFPRGRAD